ncbi:hypothetical protein B0J13DRAFT_532024 [Dactylonectria estremocensis]|uniref:Lytic polysaccharide monooxygenase n=1 Tax=Dactylonectria estremocensis TaxID=1079267 RepID=A0A9P9DMG7_9HYPO|nr:hypothetical protein B0J13DRAFT_532024 [Dactylonectria estremocensis]
MWSLKSFVTANAFVAQAASHVVMIEPHPYNLDTPPLAQVWPLTADLWPWPCQGMHDIEEVTTVTAGSTQTVRFWGSAVHGGGSCQFSIAYGDIPPDDISEWHTIYTIIGGCPAKAVGNVPTTETDMHGRENGPQCGNDSGTECTRQFIIPIPKQMKNGPAIFAWTWFNKIGNREMYMTCAPVKVVGGTGDEAFIDSLPPIFRANIPGECTSGDGIIGFPDPGDFGVINDGITPGSNGACELGVEPVFQIPAGVDASQPASVSEIPSTPLPTSAGLGETHSALTTSLNTMVSLIPPDTFVTVPTSPPATTPERPPTTSIPKSTTQVPVATSIVTSQVAPPDTASYAAPSSSGKPWWAVDHVPCPNSGALMCITPKIFGICNNGWALPQVVPIGTVCVLNRIAHEQQQ